MKLALRITAAALLAGSTPFFHACNTVTGEQTTTAAAEAGVPGGVVRQTTQVRATVTGIDPARRNVTLVTPAGERLDVTAGPEVLNFGQIRVGDQLFVTYAEQVVLRMARSGEVLDEGSRVAAARNPLGEKPGVAVGQSTQATATVTAIDTKRRKVTLRFSDGSTEKFAVRDDIDLSRHRVGEKVVINWSEALAIKVEKP